MMEQDKKKYRSINIIVVENGYFASDRDGGGEMVVRAIGAGSFVFESFETLVKFLQENMEHPTPQAPKVKANNSVTREYVNIPGAQYNMVGE